ncbi:GNAT family N-acetyltransferase [bacterium]|nr:GNAT family N-acetyltransferase [bacterium]
MENSNLTLTTLLSEMREALIDYAAEFSAAGEPRYAHITAKMSQEDYVELLGKQRANSRGENLPPGRVAETVFFLVRDGNYLIGSSRLRHSLTPSLENEGGHIGYDVRPSQRGKGYATQLLSLVLEEARSLGLSRVLVTCDDVNIASARVIEKNGGKLINKVVAEEDGQLVRRYWIEL